MASKKPVDSPLVVVDAPPSYDDCGHTDSSAARLGNTHGSELGIQGKTPTVSQIICHLKLLYAFSKLKARISSLDGLFGIFSLPDNEPDDDFEDVSPSQALLRARIREKRWAVYVQRAAQRFERWWFALRAQRDAEWLQIRTMARENSEYYLRAQSPTDGSGKSFLQGMMPPLGKSFYLFAWYNVLLSLGTLPTFNIMFRRFFNVRKMRFDEAGYINL